MKTIHFIAGVLALSILAACSSSNEKKKGEGEPHVMSAMGMETLVLGKSKPKISVRLTGELISDREVMIYAKVPSYVKSLLVDVGSKVAEGDVLLEMEAPEIISQRASAYAKLKAQEAIYISTKATYDRIIKASKTEGAVSKDDIDVITAKKDADEAQLAAAKSVYEELKAVEDYLVIRAPFSGVISERNTDLGSYVGPNGKGSDKPLLVLQKDMLLRLILSIPEAQTPYVNLGDTVTFTTMALPQKEFLGVIVRKSGALDTRLRSERIEVDIQNPKRVLLPRMVVDAVFKLKAADSTFFIPKSALVDANIGVYVMKIVDGKTKRLNVRKGRYDGMMVEIFGNLKKGDVILSKVSEETKEDMPIAGK